MARPRQLGYGEGSVYKELDPETGEVIRWRGELGTGADRRRVSGSTRREVTAKLDELRAAGSDGDIPSENPTIGTWLDWWLSTVSAGKDPVTANRDRWAVGHLSSLRDKRLRALRRVDVQGCLSALATRPVRPFRPRSCQAVQSTLRQAIQEAIDHHPELGITHNVAAGTWTPPGAPPAKTSRELTRAEARALIEAAVGTEHHAMLVLMCHMPLRPGEVLGLRWPAVDLDAATIAIRSTRRQMPDCSMATGEVKRHNDRTGVLPPVVVAALRAHQSRQRRERMAAVVWAEPGDYVFSNAIGEPLTSFELYNIFRQLSRQAGIAVCAPYSTRHAAVSFLVDGGEALQVVADLAGNTLEVMSRHYRYRTGGPIDATAAQERMLDG